jgi:peptide/nickel transport system substrate-binding protein
LQDAYKKIGVELLIKNEPARVLFGESAPKLKYGSMTMFAWTFMPEVSMKKFFHSKYIPSKENGFSGSNWNGWDNKRVDQIVTDWEVEFDEKKRKKLTNELITYYTDEVPVIPLYYRSDVSVTPKNLKGYQLSSNLFQATNHIEDWKL